MAETGRIPFGLGVPLLLFDGPHIAATSLQCSMIQSVVSTQTGAWLLMLSIQKRTGKYQATTLVTLPHGLPRSASSGLSASGNEGLSWAPVHTAQSAALERLDCAQDFRRAPTR